MAVIGSKPRMHRVGCDSEFQKLARHGLVTDFATPVEEGTYPRSGMGHPTLAMGDHLELVIGKRGLRLLEDKQPLYEVTGIELQRDIDSQDWVWTVHFRKLEAV